MPIPDSLKNSIQAVNEGGKTAPVEAPEAVPVTTNDAIQLFNAYREAVLSEAKQMKSDWLTTGAALFEVMSGEAPAISETAKKKAIAPDAKLETMMPLLMGKK